MAPSLRCSVFLAVLSVSACGKPKEAATAELARIDAACAQQDQDGARRIMAEAAKANRTFREAYEAAKQNWGVSDESKLNPCGILLEDVRRRIDATK